MYSQCPECQTRFRVTAAALRAAHGTVRCGRCGSAFDALQTLTDSLAEEPVPAAMPSRAGRDDIPLGVTSVGADADADVADLSDTPMPAAGPNDDDDVVAEFHFSADDLERVFVDARDWHRQFGGPSGASTGPDAQSLRDSDQLRTDDARRPPPQEPGDVFVHEPEAVEDITLEGEQIVIEGAPGFPEPERDEPYTGRDDAIRLEPEGSREAAAVEPVVDLDATDEFEILRDVPEAAEPPPAELLEIPAANEPAIGGAAVAAAAEETWTRTTPETAVAEPARRATAESTATTPAPHVVPFRLRDRSRTLDESELGGLEADDAEASGGRRAGALWAVGSVLLVLVLLAQVVHHYRHELVRDARIGDALRSVYAQAGRPLAPDWDLAAFELQQWGTNEADLASGAMTVRASLRNGADFAQPLPLLRMEFEDRFGGIVARRDFEPREYLKDPAQASRMLEPGGRTEAELAVADVGSDAVGYRLDVCLRDDSQGVRCAQLPAPGGRPR